MKAFSLALAAAAVGLPAASASAAIITVGSPLAIACYEAAEGTDTNPAALDTCTRALETALDRNDRAGTFVNRGILRMRHRDFTAAEADFNSALDLQPRLADAWLNKGFLRLETGAGSDAIPYLEKALQLHARRPALAYVARGLAHEQAGDFRSAYADLKRARDLEPRWKVPAEELKRYRVDGR
jgi:tetratricopeptide (TPR) repeat protein